MNLYATDADLTGNNNQDFGGLGEHGYFTASQFEELWEWVDKRIQNMLNISIIGTYGKTGMGFQLKGRIIPQRHSLERKSLIILSSNFETSDSSSSIPYILEIHGKSVKGLKIQGRKEKLLIINYVVENTFQKPKKKMRAFSKRYLFRAFEYQDRYLVDWHIRMVAIGKIMEVGIPQYSIIDGMVVSRKKYKKKIHLKDFHLHSDFLRTGDDSELPFKKAELSIYLRKMRTRDYEYHYFEPELVVVVLEKSRLIKQNIISVRNLTVKFGKRVIIDKASFDIRHGSIIGIIGESGAGKSTTVKSMLAQVPYKGEISIMGINAQETKRIAPHIGFVPQDLTMIYHEFNAFENMVHFGTQYNLEEQEITQKAKNILKDLNMSRYMEKPVEELSGGQKRRVSIAVALVHDPTILILDEPTSGLDPMTRFSLWRFLDRINKLYGITLIVISHYLDEIEYSDKSAIYLKGIGFFDYDSPEGLKKKLPGGGMALEITLMDIDLRANEILEKIPHVEAVIQRGVRLRVLSNIHTEEMKIIVERHLREAGIAVYSLTAEIEVDMMDYFTYFSRKLGSGKNMIETNEKNKQKHINSELEHKNSQKQIDEENPDEI
ncbi:Vitamin B12 import ATP-binding protein BtuD [Candidatus Lokiarchaeum ossiferum]|uniref:Vitamin B12 import ATP-binding protein BtuD n=1 Tax=Candidatus Lokiarchaeum ossiferum TaxID=2951803 RepID=A0ABY6HKV8_9ARCH|nr:Vitamin B12 import ATP-binding protein BtuD [Candidatus Lokiarchaeum sp. B-35]